MGEQGTEAMHAHFNKLCMTYGSMVNKVQRLKCIMQEHRLCECPSPWGQKNQTEKENTKNRAYLNLFMALISFFVHISFFILFMQILFFIYILLYTSFAFHYFVFHVYAYTSNNRALLYFTTLREDYFAKQKICLIQSVAMTHRK